MFVHQWGQGPDVVLVHGAVLGGREAWRGQRPLTERWTLHAVDRPGHGRSPAVGRQDFEAEAALVADEVLDRPVHLVGYSYGGLVAMDAALLRPDAVLSLTVVEPPATWLALGNPVVDAWAAELRALCASTEPAEQMLRKFLPLAGAPVELTDPVHPTLLQGAERLRGARPPDEARPRLDALREADFPMLAVSGGHMEEYEAICDAIAKGTGAERVQCKGMAHLVPDVGEPFNTVLERFWRR
ncbi:alpha/beta fold hydrolase [Kutzneria chonburiensis]|uniref:Alpha/beta fold hydrolase n=1 Tax=Kutzneria chonburiensis TaxID=1483604 RepID=A0ABV6MMG4_9PSEU|nr:alpha/beta hydrolase [Kutzneria chonburiensis]